MANDKRSTPSLQALEIALSLACDRIRTDAQRFESELIGDPWPDAAEACRETLRKIEEYTGSQYAE